MKIRSNFGQPTSLRSVQDTSEQIKNQQQAQQAEQAAAPRGDTVNISANLRSNDVQANDDSGERARRVADIKSRVQNGTYNLDSSDVAKAVIRDLFT